MDLLERASFSRMQDTLAEVMHGHGRVALVTGETGIGKTSLVEHFAERQKNGCQVLWGGCDALFTPRPPRPLYNIAHQLRGNLINFTRTKLLVPPSFSGAAKSHLYPPSYRRCSAGQRNYADLLKFLGRRINNSTGC